MARVRLRFRMRSEDGGEKGVPLLQLGRVAEEAAKFLRSMAEDHRLRLRPEDWRAIAPRRGSFAFDIESALDIPARDARAYLASVSRVGRYKPQKTRPPANVRRETLVQYAKIGTALDEGQSVEISIYPREAKRPKPVAEITEPSSRFMLESLEEVVQYYGSVQGTPHSLNIGSSPAFFQLRQLATGELVRCDFKPELRSDVVNLFRVGGTVVLVSGFASASRELNSVSRLSVERIEECEGLSAEEFEEFFGSAPNLTGDQSTEEFVESVRSRDD